MQTTVRSARTAFREDSASATEEFVSGSGAGCACCHATNEDSMPLEANFNEFALRKYSYYSQISKK